MYTREQLTRMRVLFRRKLVAERDEVPTRGTAEVRASDRKEVFPELSEEAAARLALRELETHWVQTDSLLISAAGRFMALWFTDARGQRRRY